MRRGVVRLTFGGEAPVKVNWLGLVEAEVKGRWVLLCISHVVHREVHKIVGLLW